MKKEIKYINTKIKEDNLVIQIIYLLDKLSVYINYLKNEISVMKNN